MKKWSKTKRKWSNKNKQRPEIYFLEQNRKNYKTQNFAARMENGQCSQKNVFDENFGQNLFLWAKFNLSEPFGHSKHPKYGRQQYGANMVVKNPKTCWPFLHLSWTRTDHLTWPIDKARSQLFRTFFLASLRSFKLPNGLICFRPFFAFWWFWWIFIVFHALLLINPPRAPFIIY